MLGGIVDIGGTKSLVAVGNYVTGQVLDRSAIYRTQEYSVDQLLTCLVRDLKRLVEKTNQTLQGIGISCGGPLDSQKGIILGPPNLPGWSRVAIVEWFEKSIGVKAWLCNDANACALAEWRYGASRGTKDNLFLTFGTGMGAGLILGGQLYSGRYDMAGEVGHIRLASFGPVGYGKRGSFEGFCSGGGMTQLGEAVCREYQQMGQASEMVTLYQQNGQLTAKEIGYLAIQGDVAALQVIELVGQQLGRGLALLIDLLTPEVIVIGSIFERLEKLLRPPAEEVIRQEVLAANINRTKIKAAELGDDIGLYAGLSIVAYHLSKE